MNSDGSPILDDSKKNSYLIASDMCLRYNPVTDGIDMACSDAKGICKKPIGIQCGPEVARQNFGTL